MKKHPVYLLLFPVISLTPPAHAAEEFGDGPEYTVATPAKMAQSIKDVPAAVTIIEGETIRRLGHTNIPDILRLAPGFVSAQGNAWDYRVAYHGTNNFNTRRMQVLVDGMSAYRSGLAKVDWLMLPVAIKDIDRIEVTRSPSSASYGANAFQAVVNIITKQVKQSGQVSASTSRNSRGVNQSYLRYENAAQKTNFSASVEHTKSDGSYMQQQLRLDPQAEVFVKTTPEYLAEDGYEYSKLNLSGEYQIDNKNSAKLSVGGVRSLQDMGKVAHYTQVDHPNADAVDNFINFAAASDSFDNHHIKFEASRYQTRYTREWINCYPQFLLTKELAHLYELAPDEADLLGLRGITPPNSGNAAVDAAIAQAVARRDSFGSIVNAYTNICGTINQNFIDSKNTFELRDVWAINEALHVVTGVGTAHNATDSETFLKGTVEQDKRWIYTNAEWLPITKLTLNAGTMLERDSINRETYSMPRLAAGYEFMPNQVLKYIIATSRRAPDLTETNLFWQYKLTDMQTPLDGKNWANPYRYVKSKNNLVAERDFSQSVIWLGRSPEFGINYEVKLFKESLDKLISENFGSTENLSNDGKAELKGAEYQVRYKLTPELTLLNSYSYLLNSANNSLETLLYAKHSGSLALLADIGKYEYGFAYYGSDFENADSFDQFEALVGRHYKIAGSTLFWQAKLNWLPNNSYSQIEAGIVKFTNRHRNDLAAGLEVGVDW